MAFGHVTKIPVNAETLKDTSNIHMYLREISKYFFEVKSEIVIKFCKKLLKSFTT